jgi:Flp pilus assembly protein TadG
MKKLIAFFKSPRKLWKDSSGVSSVEFALIAPIMILLFLGMVEISDGLTAKRKVTASTSTVADLIGRAKTITDADVLNVYEAASAILEPYNTTNVEIRITSVNIQLDGTPIVGWSDALNTAADNPGDKFVLPTGIAQPGGSVIVAKVSYTHSGVIGSIVSTPKTYADTFFIQPRRTLQIQRL